RKPAFPGTGIAATLDSRICRIQHAVVGKSADTIIIGFLPATSGNAAVIRIIRAGPIVGRIAKSLFKKYVKGSSGEA
ncbi:MAG: hypothetical protein P4L87_22015, partial [Formivibrio sp.]|nr:hypothetical protein [Formivibrio sp.]